MSSNINYGRKISISFIKILRKYFDDYMSPFLDSKDMPLVDVYIQGLHDKIAVNNKMSDEVTEEIKNIVFQYQEKLVEKTKKFYDDLIVRAIDDAMYDIEKTMNSNFTENELSEIYLAISNPVIEKFICDFSLMDCLQNNCNKFYVNLQSKLQDIYMDPDFNKEMVEKVQEILSKHGYHGDSEVNLSTFVDQVNMNDFNMSEENDLNYDNDEDDNINDEDDFEDFGTGENKN